MFATTAARRVRTVATVIAATVVTSLFTVVGTTGPARYRDRAVSMAGPIMLASRRIVTAMSDLRRPSPRA